MAEEQTTARRLLHASLGSFAERGFEATSLDEIAEQCGVRKQTLLYHYSSKERLLHAVIDHTVNELAAVVRRAIAGGRDPHRATVDALFRVGSTRSELLEFVREVLRLGPPASTYFLDAAEPFVQQLTAAVPRNQVLVATSIILGLATESDVANALGVPPSIAQLRRRRQVLLDYLTASVDVENAERRL